MDKETLNRWASAALERAGYSQQRSRDAKREAWWWLKARLAAPPGRPLHAGHAVVWTHPGRCELIPVDEPGPSRDAITVAVTDSIVSTGTERAQYVGRTNAELRYPARPGYAAAGVVVAAGRASDHPVGAHVAVPLPHCSVGTLPSGAAYPVPASVSLTDAAFTQLGIIARRGVALGKLVPGEEVCVLGCGVIGLLAARIASAGGAGRVTAVARSRRREHLARAGGASAFVATREQATLAGTEADLVIEATGDPQALVAAVEAARAGGRIVLLGSPYGPTRGVPVDAIREKGLTVVGGHVSTLSRAAGPGGGAFRAEGAHFLELLASGAVRVADLIEATVDPRDAASFYRRLALSDDVPVARFDWTLLARQERDARASRLARPRISARGVDFEAKPLSVSAETADELVADPLGDASGNMGIALVGCGDIGIQNAAAISAAPNARLVACFDPVGHLAVEVGQAHGARVASSFEELLALDEVSAVFLSVPHDLHAPLAGLAAEAGRHVIVEKPPAQSLAAAQDLTAAAERHGVEITVCFPHRYASASVAARSLIERGALGELRGTLLSFLTDKPPSYWHGGFSGRAVSDWRALRERTGGGVLIMNLSHYVDLILSLTGTPVEEVTALVSSLDSRAEVEDFVSASVRYGNGAIGNVFGGTAVPGTWEGRTSTELRLWGDDGHISLGNGLQVFSLRAQRGLRAGRWHTFDRLPPVALRTAFVSRFATAVDRGTPPDVTLEAALDVQAVIEATYRSASEQRPVAIAEVLGDVSALAPAAIGRRDRP